MRWVISAVVCVLVGGATAVFAQPQYTRVQEADFHRAVTRAFAHGAYDEARAAAEERDASAPSAAAVLARLDFLRGDYAAAEARLMPVAERHPISGASLELALLQQYLGLHDEATRRFRVLIGRLQRSSEALDLYRAALAARALDEFQLAPRFVRNASLAAPDDPAIHTLWGELLTAKYDQREAARSFGDALTLDDEWAPAHLGLARALADTNPPAARSSVGRALEIDPDFLEAHLFLAQRDLDDRDHDAARESLGRAVEITEHSLEAGSLVAAVASVDCGR